MNLTARSLAAVLAAAINGSAVAQGAVVEVEIVNAKFIPEVVRVKKGDTVRWVNHEKRANHSILFAAEGMPESERFFPGESWQRRFDKPGRYPYLCGPHPDMKGVVEVGD